MTLCAIFFVGGYDLRGTRGFVRKEGFDIKSRDLFKTILSLFQVLIESSSGIDQVYRKKNIW
jgi:hypothetical protein